MDELPRVLFLAVVQGIAEFLPISSSGHLVICGALWSRITGAPLVQDDGLELEVALHAGTLISILVVYARDLWELRRQPRLCGMVLLGSVPAAIVGIGFKDLFEAAFDSPTAAGFGLLMTAMFLTLGSRFERPMMTDKQIPWPAAFTIGCFQAVAIFPGISRSGSTITGGLITGLDRLSATRFSFLLAIPAIGGATLLTLKDTLSGPPLAISPAVLLIGAAVSAIVGYFSLTALLRIVSRGRLSWFAWYCAAAGLLVLVWQSLESSGADAAAI
jgi:undecaprenyl-diphosphatase